MKKTQVETKCAMCEETIFVKYSWFQKSPNGRFFCSRDCYWSWRREHEIWKTRDDDKWQECTCAYCGVAFERLKVTIKSEMVYCSQDCKVNGQRLLGEENRTCKVCGKEFVCAITSRQKTCSHECNHVRPSNLVEISCLQCGKKCLKHPSDLKRGAKFCSPECSLAHQAHTGGVKQNTKPERLTKQWLRSNGIRYFFQRHIERMVVDFYLPEYDCVLEVNGDYWHANPKKFKEDELNEVQRRGRTRDAKKAKRLGELGYALATVWESDIKADLNRALAEVLAPYRRVFSLGNDAVINVGVEQEHTTGDALAFIAQFGGI